MARHAKCFLVDTQPLGTYHPPMQRFLILLGIFFIAVGMSCGGSGKTSPILVLAVEGGTITSDDDSFTLSIPSGALAEDTEISV